MYHSILLPAMTNITLCCICICDLKNLFAWIAPTLSLSSLLPQPFTLLPFLFIFDLSHPLILIPMFLLRVGGGGEE